MRLDGQVELLTHVPTIGAVFQQMQNDQTAQSGEPRTRPSVPNDGGETSRMTAEEVREGLGHSANSAAATLYYADGDAAKRTHRLPRFLRISDARTAMNKAAGFASVNAPGVTNDDIRRSIDGPTD
jgi:hypothetical protein